MELATALSAAMASVNIVKSAVTLKNDTDIALKVADVVQALGNVQGALIEMQAKAFDAARENEELKRKLIELEKLDRYELCEPYPGTMLYRIKKDEKRSDEPDHFICPACMAARKQTFPLQGNIVLVCPNTDCKAKYRVAKSPETPRHPGITMFRSW